MEFLSNAIISSQDSSLLGAVITHFDPEDYLKRCETRLYTTDELVSAYPTFAPRGFIFKDGNNLFGDTSVQGVVANSAFEYMTEECAHFGQRGKDITDLVLLGAKCGGFVLAGYKDDTDQGSFIPFSSFRVSNSSFNLYASYQTDSGEFRTYSLLRLEDGSALEHYIALPKDVNLEGFAGKVEMSGATQIEDAVYTVYHIEMGLTKYYAAVGEAFLNYLAYNIAFYNIGEKMLKEFRNVVSPPVGYERPVDEGVIRFQRKASVNVSIVHVCKEPRLSSILQCTNDAAALQKLVDEYPEAEITWHWLCRLYRSPWFTDSYGKMDENQARYVAAVNLLPICRQERLKFAVELLTHRYYLSGLGLVGDTLGPILHGGGVKGESIKRVDFGVR